MASVNRPPSHRTLRAARILAFCLLLLASIASATAGPNSVHTSWLWHLHQPIYWPDRRAGAGDHYEAAWDTIQQQNAGRAHPSPEILSQIFGLSDRVAAYQYRPHDALNALLSYPNAGAQASFSGALMENVQSLAQAGQLGYTANWNSYNQQARSWNTSGGQPRLDLVNFTYHHALAPLLSDETLEMELRIHQRQMQLFWGTSVPLSRGYFPTETCFSERMIPILKKVGIDWTVVANTHLTRSCADFPLVLGSGGENCDIPNRADQLNPPQGAGNYQRVSIERGCSPSAAMPFAFQAHYARHVDPDTGLDSRILVVPSDQALGWRDSYGSWDVGLMGALAARNNPAKPALVLLAHDGDNAWSGGYSYYLEWVNNFTSQANSAGYEPSTVEQFLAENPPNTNDIVHVEDGGWVYADSDFGSPIFINWHWPPSYQASGKNVVDPSLGTSDKADNWRVIVATENRVKTAQQIASINPRIDQVRDPGSFSQTPNPVELGWHYYLAGLDSGFVYYGCHDDECQRAVVAQSNATRHVDPILAAAPSADNTQPTVFSPQRHPWNPGGTNFGVQYNYQLTVAPNSDFWVWTYAYDVSGITNATLHLRVNGTNPPTSDQFKTYAGGPLTGPWTSSNLTQRVVPPVIGVTPSYIADYYFAKVSGISNAYVDYYIAAVDGRGNLRKSPIQHVYVGANADGSGVTDPEGCNGRVCVSPVPPAAGAPATLRFNPAGGPLENASPIFIHLGWNHWNPVLSPDAAMTFNSLSNVWEYTVTVPTTASELNCVFNNGAGVWDNNNGADWNFSCANTTEPPTTNDVAFQMDGAFDAPGLSLASSGMVLHGAVRGNVLYVATWSPGNSGPNDHFIFVSDQLLPTEGVPAPWGKSGNVPFAAGKPFLAAESQNSYLSWYSNGSPLNSPCAKGSTSSGALEGAINLTEVFGYVPTNIYLCAAAYQTADAGNLAAQCPAGSGPDINTNECFLIPTLALRDQNADGTFDRLDPEADFRLLSPQLVPGSCVFTWATMPGRDYQVLTSPDLTGLWTNLPGAFNRAGPLQLFMAHTDAPPPSASQRFYRIQLLP